MSAAARCVNWMARLTAWLFYRVDVAGSVPAAGPLLLLPNHPNALLDPALIIATANRRVRFLAKSTLFRGPFASLLSAAGAIPVYRRQDTSDTARNEETFAAVDRALAAGEAVCIFPEGISHSSGRLEPLRTGAARMAASAFAAGVPLRLVPVGVNLESKITFRSRALIAYGQPFVPASRDIRTMTVEITEHLRRVMIEADPAGDAALVDRVDRLYRTERDAERDPESSLARRRAIAGGLRRLRLERPDWYADALVQLRRYDERMQRFGLHDAALNWTISPALARQFVVRELPLAVVLLPIAMAAVATFWVPYAITWFAARQSSETDVTATVKVITGSIVYGLWTVALATAAAFMWGIPGLVIALLGLPCLALAGLLSIEREAASWRTARAWISLRGRHQVTRAALKRRRAELAAVLDEMAQWLEN